MSHAILPAALAALCVAAAFIVSWDLAPLILKPRPRRGSAGLPNLDHVLPGLRARLDGDKLRARSVRTARPDGTAPSIPDEQAASGPVAGAVPLAEPERFARAMHKALHALDDVARTRDDLTVINAGGMLLPDRPRTTYEPGPFRIPPYYLKYEADKAAGRWLP